MPEMIRAESELPPLTLQPTLPLELEPQELTDLEALRSAVEFAMAYLDILRTVRRELDEVLARMDGWRESTKGELQTALRILDRLEA